MTVPNLTPADIALLDQAHAAAGDLRILAAETLARRAAGHTPPAVANAEPISGPGQCDGMGGSGTGELSGPELTFFERRAARDPSIDHSSHSQAWVGRCLECPDDGDDRG